MSENDTHAPVEAVSKTNVPSRGILSWGLLVSMLAAYGGIAIQIAGQARHQSWHERFGTDAGLFPWSLDQNQRGQTPLCFRPLCVSGGAVHPCGHAVAKGSAPHAATLSLV